MTRTLRRVRRNQLHSIPMVRTSLAMPPVLFAGIDRVIAKGGQDGEPFDNRVDFLREITARYLASIGIPVE